MWNDGGDPVAALDRLDRMRGAQVAREYTDWAGIDRGYQTIWSGRPGVWIRGRVIDLGRRPDTGRAAPAHLRAQNSTKPAPRRAANAALHEDDILRFFAGRNNTPATVKEIAAALPISEAQVFRVLSESRRIVIVYKAGGGGKPSLHAPAGAPVEIDVRRTMALGERAIYETLIAAGGEMTAADLADATGFSQSLISRATRGRADLFCVEKRKIEVNGTKTRRAYIWLNPTGEAK